MTYRIPVEELSYGVLDMKPVDTEWDSERLMNQDWSFWEAQDYDLDDGRTLIVVIRSGNEIAAAFTDDGLRISFEWGEVDLDSIECLECEGAGAVLDLDSRELTDDACPDCDGTGNQAKLTEDQIADLNGKDAHEFYAGGPMMNYRYPTGDTTDSVGGYRNSSDAAEAAYKLRHTNLCIVEYDDEVALALTGGGMDFSWEIIDAFTKLGYMPPVHFDLPGMAGRGTSEDDRYLIAAVDRSISAMVETAQHKLTNHRQRWNVSLTKEN